MSSTRAMMLARTRPIVRKNNIRYLQQQQCPPKGPKVSSSFSSSAMLDEFSTEEDLSQFHSSLTASNSRKLQAATTTNSSSTLVKAFINHNESFFNISSVVANSNNITNQKDKETVVGIDMIELHKLASQTCTPVSLRNMYKYASANVGTANYFPQRLRNAQFLHREIQIRLAQRCIDLIYLPYGLNTFPSIREITNYFYRYLQIFKSFPCPKDKKSESAFTDLLRNILLNQMLFRRHSLVV